MSFFKYFQFFYTFLGWRLLLIFFFAALGALSEALGIVLIGGFFGNLTGEVSENSGSFINTYVSIFSGDMIFDSIIVIAFFLGKSIFLFCTNAYAAFLRGILIKELKFGLFNQSFDLKSNNKLMSRFGVGSFSSLINDQGDKVLQGFQVLINIITFAVPSLIIFFVIFYLNAKILLLSIFLFSILWVIFSLIGIQVKKRSKELVAQKLKLNSLNIEFFTAFDYLRTTSREKYALSSVKGIVDKITTFQFTLGIYNAFVTSAKEPFALVCIFILLFVFQASGSGQGITDFAVIGMLLYRNQSLFGNLMSAIQNLYETFGSFDLVKSFQSSLASASSDKLSKDRYEGWKVGGELGSHLFEVVNGQIADSAGNRLVDGIFMTIREKEMTVITGQSGSGKSTLLRVIVGLDNPTAGEWCVGKRLVGDGGIRPAIGYVAQRPMVFSDTVFNNVTMGEVLNIENAEKRVEELLSELELQHLIDFGVHKSVPECGLPLSGGQAQRLALARELYFKPDVLILDEISSALDNSSEMSLLECLLTIKDQLTLVVVSHSDVIMNAADSRYHINEGSLHHI